MVAPRTLRDENKSKQAYTLVDLNDLDPVLRDDIILDASEGAGIYGIRVVEEAINGPVRQPVYGVYNDGPDAERWQAAKEKLELDSVEIDDTDVRAIQLRETAATNADAAAEAQRLEEEKQVAAIVGEDKEAEAQGTAKLQSRNRSPK